MVYLRFYKIFFRYFDRILKEQWGAIVTENILKNSKKDM